MFSRVLLSTDFSEQAEEAYPWAAKLASCDGGTVVLMHALEDDLVATAPVFAGYMADVNGDYVIGFSVLGIGALLGSLCFVFARAPVHPDGDKLVGEK